MNDINRIIQDFTLLCDDDCTSLYSLYAWVQEEYPNASQTELREVTISILQDLLLRKIIVPLEISEMGGIDVPRSNYEWHCSPEEAVAKIRKEWEALGRELQAWEIVAFDTGRLQSQREKEV